MEKRLLKIGARRRGIGHNARATAQMGTVRGIAAVPRKTKGGTRYYAVSDLLGVTNESAPTICYARVSSHDQKADLDRQHAVAGRPTVRLRAGGRKSSATSAPA